MKKLFGFLAIIFLILSTAAYSTAMPFQFAVNGGGLASAVTVNHLFDVTGTAEIFNAFTSSTDGTFDEVGTFRSDGYDGAGDYGNYQFTAVFEASGDVNATDFTFSPGGTLTMYVQDKASAGYTPYGDTNDSGASSPVYGANDGTAIAVWDLLGGGGKIGDNFTPDKNGTITANFVATSIAAGYFFDSDNNDLSAWTTTMASPILTIGIATTNAHVINPPNQNFAQEIDELAGFTVPSDSSGYVNDLDASDGSQTFNVSNNGQWEINVVPEPATLMLLGIGLLGLSGITRRKAS